MINIFLFLQLSSSKLFPFTPQSFQNAIEASRMSPLIAYFYSSECQHCHLPEFQTFAENSAYNEMVNFTAIDCRGNEILCTKFDVHYVPLMYFITGPNNKEQADFYNYLSDQFLEYKLLPKISETNHSIDDVLDNEKFGKEGSTFYYVTNSRNDFIITLLENLSKPLKYTECTFYYKIDPNIADKERHLTVVQKRNCPIVYYVNKNESLNIQQIKQSIIDFVDKYKYSIFHHYEYFDVMKLPPEQLFTYYFAHGNITDAELYNFNEFASNECSDVIYGIVSKIDQRDFMKHSHLTYIDLPAIVTVDRSIKCTYTWKKGFKLYKTNYLKNILDRKCNKEEIIPSRFHFPYLSLISFVFMIVALFLRYFHPRNRSHRQYFNL